MTEDEKARLIEISNGLHNNQVMLDNYKEGDPEPCFCKLIKEGHQK